MKTRNAFVIASFICVRFLYVQSTLAQGSLTPPGPPGPTMITLAQIEPRTPISSSQFQITQPGSYYLTTNIVVTDPNEDGIDVYTNAVTLDLNGFTISCFAGSAYNAGIGIIDDTLNSITIHNGHIVGGYSNQAGVYSGDGFSYGIIVYGNVVPSPANLRITDVTVSGVEYDGIDAGLFNSSVVESCIVQQVGGVGISGANVSHSVAYQCGDHAIEAINASDCTGSCPGYFDGIYSTTAFNCTGSSSGGYGVYATTANNCTGTSTNGVGVGAYIATGCYGTSTTAGGIVASISATGCYGTSTSGTGLQASIANTCWGSSSSGIGLNATIANTCYSSSGDGNIVNKYNMP